MALELTNSVEVYLKANPDGPFMGSIPFEKGQGVHEGRKEAIKDHGARWTPNPDFVEVPRSGPKYYKSVLPAAVRGWWTAPNRRVLVELLKLKPGEGMGSKALWIPRGLCPLGAAIMLKRCVEDQNKQEEGDAKARTKREPSLADKEREKRSRLNIPEDTEAEIAELCEHGIGYSSELMERARCYVSTSTAFTLGPRSGISDAARVLRGIRLCVVTVEEAKECARQKERLVSEPPPQVVDQDSAPEEVDLYKVVKKRRVEAEDGDTKLVTDMFDEGVVVAYIYDGTHDDTVKCEQCKALVSLQFMECGCAYSVWEHTGDASLLRRVE